MGNRVVHFEIPVDDMQRARTFYIDMFGWDISKWNGPIEYWSAKTGEGAGGINGALLPRGGAVATVVNTVSVENLDAALAKLVQCGGSVESPKIAIPNVGDFAYGKDTEGNVFGLLEVNSSERNPR